MVLSWRFPCCSFSLPEVSQRFSQLIQMSLLTVLASGLEIRNPLRNRQEKNEFKFQSQQKNYLTRKIKRACRCENKKASSRKFLRTPNDNRFGVIATNRLACWILASPS